jgi:hypothetical protein
VKFRERGAGAGDPEFLGGEQVLRSRDTVNVGGRLRLNAVSRVRVLAENGSVKRTGAQCLLSAQDRGRFSASMSWPATAQACGKVGVWPGQVGGRPRLGLALACNRSKVVSACAKRLAGFSTGNRAVLGSQRLLALQKGRLQASAALACNPIGRRWEWRRYS